MRLCERFQKWIPNPAAFYELDINEQASLIGYELVREAEEAQIRSL